jgi:hypothetical protein
MSGYRDRIVSFYIFNEGTNKFRMGEIFDLSYMNLDVMLWVYVPIDEVVGDVYGRSMGVTNLIVNSVMELIEFKVPLSSLERLRVVESILEEL